MEKKLFISSDIEGICGVAHWDETLPEKPDYDAFADQMSREVAAACEGALSGGASSVLVRDAHNTARNIRPFMLPDSEKIRIFRGWGRDPYGMMSGLDESFSGAMFTGYHSACGWSGNPLSHTMNTRNIYVKVNGEVCSELMMNSLTAAMFGVPVLMVTGDEMLCDWFKGKVPGAVAVPVSHGVGNGSISIMPGEAVRRIRAGAEEAAQKAGDMSCLFPTPADGHYEVEIMYRQHFDARANRWYPGARQVNERTVRFACDSWMDALTFIHFCL